MINIIVIILILGCGALFYFKGTIVNGFASLVSAVGGFILSFNYYEPLGRLLLEKGNNETVLPWSYTISFLIIFLISFAILESISLYLTKKNTEIGRLSDKIGAAVLGAILALIFCGTVLVGLSFAPKKGLPYSKFEEGNIEPGKGKNAFMNADGFVSGWFSTISSGSLSGKRNFAVLHPDFVTQTHINKSFADEEVKISVEDNAITVNPKKAVWPAREDLMDSTGEPLSIKADAKAMIVRVGISKPQKFALGQVSLVIKEEGVDEATTGKSIHPIGFLKKPNQLTDKTSLSSIIDIQSKDITGNAKYIDFVFPVPEGYTPAMIKFKQDYVAELNKILPAEQAPETETFVQLSKTEERSAKIDKEAGKLYAEKLTAKKDYIKDISLTILKKSQFIDMQTGESEMMADFQDSTIRCVRAKLRTKNFLKEQLNKKGKKKKKSFTEELKKSKGLPAMLQWGEDHEMLSLKCTINNSNDIRASDLPTLVDVDDVKHFPVGLIAGGVLDERMAWQVDFCSDAEEIQTQNGVVTESFVDNVWVDEEVEDLSDFYVIYAIKKGNNTVIKGVLGTDGQLMTFSETSGFLIK